MRKIREILRLRFDCKRSYQEIAKSIGISSSTVYDCIARAKDAELSWPLSCEFTDEDLETKLYPQAQKITPDQCPAPL